MERYSDDELLYLLRCGSETAQVELYKRYYEYVKLWVLSFYTQYMSGFEYEDFVQYGMLAFSLLVDQYRDDKRTSFKTFIKNCVLKRMRSFVAKMKAMQELRNLSVISFDEFISEDENVRFEDVVSDETDERPDKIMVIRETHTYYQTMICENDMTLETQVYTLKNEGYMNTEIAKMLDISTKSVYNAAYRYHKKAQAIDEPK